MRGKFRTGSRRRLPARYVVLVLFFVAAVVGAYLYGRSQSPAGMSPGEENSVKLYAQALNIVRNHYVEQSAIKPKKMTYAAIQAMLNTLGDRGHTRFLTPEEVKSNQQELSGRYVGVGIQLEQKGKRAVIVAPIDGSPAARAGIRPGDVIVAVNGTSVRGEDLSQVARRVRGPKGTTVKITVKRKNGLHTYTLRREEVNVPAASWALLGDHVADVRLSSFSKDSASQLRKAVEAARAAGARRFILDLRDNPGGEVDQAVQAAGVFLEPGQVVYIRKDSSGARQKIRVPGGSHPVKAPLAVLVNHGTASSAEILAGALRDDGRAKVIGTRTFGTGTVLAEYSMSDGSAILLGVAEWLTPDGDFIRKSGIEPNVVVKLGKGDRQIIPAQLKHVSPKEALRKDPQLARAYDELVSRPG
ncbi:S41 family peptidase [Rubrobacter naiadicus]|uniref:S41 family peptidase n=1 Tax=Rubrobacter naiadicus TaxID=1392641 RepID=UPI00235FED98|nr:S41 family peptidase [Rubrobacter naiadicus]